MKELVSPMTAKSYRNTINSNFDLIEETINNINIEAVEMNNELFDRLDSLGYLKDLNVALNKKLTKLEQNQEKLLGSIDTLYKITKPVLIELINETERKKTPSPKKWYMFWSD